MKNCLLSVGIFAFSVQAAENSRAVPTLAEVSQWGGEIRFAIRNDPKTFDPLLSSDQSSELLVRLQHDRLLRRNRKSGKYEGALADSWKVSEQGRKIVLQLKEGIRFSDGTPFTAKDVVHTVQRVIDPSLRSPRAPGITAEQGKIVAEALSTNRVAITFPVIVPSIESEVGDLPILSAKGDPKLGLGPFLMRDYKAASHLTLVRNPNYWRTQNGKRLPYLDSLHIDIVPNADMELEKFRRGELQLLESIDAGSFDRLQKEMPQAVRDVGASSDVEFLWFNQNPSSPLAPHKREWFRSRNFRRAISAAIRREDINRLVFQGRATSAAGIMTPNNKLWFKQGLKPHSFDLAESKKLLQQDGFRLQDGTLVDRMNRPVEISIITTANNKARGRILSLLQQDLKQIGIKVNIATFDMPSLIERIGRTQNYEACLLGFVNPGNDPMNFSNMLLSSGPQHMWNPSQKSPASAWEAEMDKAMMIQASTADFKKRHSAFERVQQILHDESPVLFLSHRNALVAVASSLGNADPSVEFPRVVWNSDRLVWSSR
jgi:peptide/nickel transport system substrate-binding protein